MPTTYKVLGQSNPSATTATTLYTVPSATQTVVSTASIANLGAAPATFRLAIRPSGTTLANQHYIVYDASVAPQDTVTLTLGMTLGATDVVTVYASTATMAFSLFGSEVS